VIADVLLVVRGPETARHAADHTPRARGSPGCVMM
jgi:hypothetical protein